MKLLDYIRKFQNTIDCCRLFLHNKFDSYDWSCGSGLDRFEAREKLWEDLTESGLALKKEPHTLRVPRSQRGGEVCTI